MGRAILTRHQQSHYCCFVRWEADAYKGKGKIFPWRGNQKPETHNIQICMPMTKLNNLAATSCCRFNGCVPISARCFYSSQLFALHPSCMYVYICVALLLLCCCQPRTTLCSAKHDIVLSCPPVGFSGPACLPYSTAVGIWRVIHQLSSLPSRDEYYHQPDLPFLFKRHHTTGISRAWTSSAHFQLGLSRTRNECATGSWEDP
jgi:hypothetical protein